METRGAADKRFPVYPLRHLAYAYKSLVYAVEPQSLSFSGLQMRNFDDLIASQKDQLNETVNGKL